MCRAPFQNQSKLVQLSLQHNLIANIDQTSLHGLSASLTSLNLAANKLKFIHRDALRNITMLKQLQLQENELEKVPEALSHLNQLTHLNLASNLIGQLPRDFMQPGSKLQELNLAANLIPNIVQDTFNNTVDISVINLARNEIGNIDQGSLVRLSNLTELDLAHNRLTEIDGVFPSLSSLRLLNVSMNQLKWFDMAFVPKQLLVVDIQVAYTRHKKIMRHEKKQVASFFLQILLVFSLTLYLCVSLCVFLAVSLCFSGFLCLSVSSALSVSLDLYVLSLTLNQLLFVQLDCLCYIVV